MDTVSLWGFFGEVAFEPRGVEVSFNHNYSVDRTPPKEALVDPECLAPSKRGLIRRSLPVRQMAACMTTGRFSCLHDDWTRNEKEINVVKRSVENKESIDQKLEHQPWFGIQTTSFSSVRRGRE